VKRFYVGETYDIGQRLKYHNSILLNTNSTKNGIPWNQYMLIPCKNRSQARLIEHHIKRMKSKEYIRNLKRFPEMLVKLKERFS